MGKTGAPERRGSAGLAFELSLKGRALRLLGRREHTRRELERKLARYESEPGTLAQALNELQDKGYLDERRAAESIVHRRAAQFGPTRLRQEMQDKGLDRALIEQALAALGDSEWIRAREVWARKFGHPPETPQERARQMRFLLARGFSTDVVRRVVVGGALDE